MVKRENSIDIIVYKCIMHFSDFSRITNNNLVAMYEQVYPLLFIAVFLLKKIRILLCPAYASRLFTPAHICLCSVTSIYLQTQNDQVCFLCLSLQSYSFHSSDTNLCFWLHLNAIRSALILLHLNILVSSSYNGQ